MSIKDTPAAETRAVSAPFPPPTINLWVRWRTVSLPALVAELRYWADYYESRIDPVAAEANADRRQLYFDGRQADDQS